MEKKQILALFVCNLAIMTVGAGLGPLLPVYATRLGADPTAAGFFIAIAFLALAAGALTAGWVSDRLRCRKLPLIMSGALPVLTTWLMGQATSVWLLTVLTALTWFLGSMVLAFVSILAGLSAREDERGRVFGLLGLAGGLGALIGSLVLGYAADRWGYSAMLSLTAAIPLLTPLAGTLLTEKQVERARGEAAPAGRAGGVRLGQSFRFLFAGCLVCAASGSMVGLVRSLRMDSLGFGATEIASTGAVGGIIAMPVPLLAGWLSDRGGRKPFLYLAYLGTLASLAGLAVATSLWHFWVVMALGAAFGFGSAVGNALVTDLVPPAALARGLSLYTAAGWLGAVLGYAITGALLQGLGAVPTLLVGMSLVLFATALLIPIRTRSRDAVLITPTGAT